MLRKLVYAILVLMASSFVTAVAQTNVTPAAQDELLKPKELDSLVAPIALYPDALLATVLMASTYPLEVVQADRWVKGNSKLKPDAQKAAVAKEDWDESVKSLVAVPDVLDTMSTQIDWTQKLGDAVLAQQADVMDAVQRLRSRAEANNKLTTTSQQRVVRTAGPSGQQVIAIEQTNPDTLYVPYYDPNVVYGDWSDVSYPPYYFGYPSYYGAGWLATGLAFGAGWALGRWATGRNLWGGSINWSNNINNINVNRPRVNPLAGNNWRHRPEHRGNVGYNNSNVAQRFGNNGNRQGVQNRMDFRGNSGKQVLNPGGDRRGAGNTVGSGNRVSTRPSTGAGGNRTAARPSTRPSGGRQTAGRGNVQHNRSARGPSHAARQSLASRGGGGGRQVSRGGGGGTRMASAGGGMRMGGGGMRAGGGGHRGGGGRGGGGRRSDIELKHDIALIGYLDNGLGFYRFSYNGSNRAYVGVIAQEVLQVIPEAVTRGPDGYLRVQYDKLGVPFQSYEQWIRTGARVPGSGPRMQLVAP